MFSSEHVTVIVKTIYNIEMNQVNSLWIVFESVHDVSASQLEDLLT